MDATKEAFFLEHVLDQNADGVRRWGFKDIRLGVLTDEEVREQAWDYFGSHGCWIGAAPMTDDYRYQSMTDPARTPFERLYYVFRGPSKMPILAYRLIGSRKDRRLRLHDPMECFDSQTPAGHLTIMQLFHEDEAPENTMTVPESYFLAHMGDPVTKWV